MMAGKYSITTKCSEHFTEKMNMEIKLFLDLQLSFVKRNKIDFY